MARKLIIANWKANPDSAARAEKLAREIEKSTAFGVEVVIAPPFPFLMVVRRVIKKAKLGAQDVFWEDIGPYTGEISATMLKNMGVKYVIVGHSERRRWLGETDEMISKKIKAALQFGLKVILCVGEPERFLSNPSRIKSNESRMAKSYVKNQLEKDLGNISLNSRLIVAYEPVWAIGTGRAAAPQDVLEMIKFIKEYLAKFLKIPALKLLVLYGGSVNSKNLAAFLKYPEIDGALVGGASLEAKDFKKMLSLA